MNKVNYRHVFFAAYSMVIVVIIAALLGYVDGFAVLYVCGTSLGTILLAPFYAMLGRK